MVRFHAVGRLGSEPRVVGRLGSGVRVSASFQIFHVTAGGNVLGVEGNCPAGELSGGGYVRGGNVLHLLRIQTTMFKFRVRVCLLCLALQIFTAL